MNSDSRSNAANQANNHNVLDSEIQKFSQHAANWWDENGPLKTLHQVNPVRMDWIQQHVELTNKKVLDVGCGGGILTEALAKAGADAVGVDMAEQSVQIARAHAHENLLSIEYCVQTAEQLALERPAAFDVIACMEMLEHVPDPAAVIQACAQLLKPQGLAFFSTLNRHPLAFGLGIVAAEYVLNWIPKGTHQYSTFIKPSELAGFVRQAGFDVLAISGIGYQPFGGSKPPFKLTQNTDVNYMILARKR